MISQMEDFTSSRAFRVSGKKAFDEAGIKHKDVDHLMIYDAFAHLPLYGLEDLGFCKRGEAAAFIGERNTAPGGKLPLNTNGGGLSYMHSGMYGMYALQESVRQMRGLAAAQVPGAKISVVPRRRRHVRRQRHDRVQQRAGMKSPPDRGTSHELRGAVRRAQGGRPEPGRGRALLRHAARPVRRRRHQGRADGRRRLGAHARRALRRPVRLFDPGQPRQALDRARSEVGGGQGGAVAADRGRRRAARGLPPRRARAAGLRLRGRRRARAAHPLSLRVGLRPDRPARRPAGDGPGAAGLHRPDAGQQGRGRHPASRAVRRHRHVDRALRLPGAVRRALRAPRRAARAAHRGQPAAGRERDAGDPDDDGLPRGRADQARHAERRVQDGRRLAAVPGRAQRQLGEVLQHRAGTPAARDRSPLCQRARRA